MFTYGNASSTRNGDDRKRPRGLSSRNFVFAFTLLVVCLLPGVDARAVPGFFDDVESGTNGWTASGLWHIVGTAPCGNSVSPTHSWYYGTNTTCTYNTGAANSGDLISSAFVIPDTTALIFQSWEQTESAGTTWDKRIVYLSTNSGASWIQLRQSVNNAAAWYQVSIDLSAYAGMQAQLRFHFETGDGTLNDFRGWYIDDVRVPAPAPPSAPTNLTAATVSTNAVRLSWGDNSVNESGFKVERAPDLGGSPGTWTQITTVGANNTAYTDTGLAMDTRYWYRVRSYNALGDSPYSNEASALVRDGQSVRVMQWNVERNLGRISSNSSSFAHAIARIVNYNQPDILLFNEIDTQSLNVGDNQAALIDWVTNSVSYLGTQPNATFYVAISPASDGFIRNAAISRYPILNATTYNDGLRGLHSLTMKLSAANALQVFHAHLKCCADDCSRKQSEAQIDANVISAWATATNTIPYIFGGDWNEDEQNPECTLSASYHPITTIREGGGLVEFKPTTLDGEYRTWSTGSGGPSIRFDYILAATNRLAPVSGYVFSSTVWGNHGLYTNTSSSNLVGDSSNASDHYCVFADYFFPDPHFTVTPTSTFASSGYLGGPFDPSNRVCTLSNVTASSLSWSVTNSASWLTISPTNGTLAGGATVDVTVSIGPAANALSGGNYSDTINFRNSTNGASVTLKATLAVQVSPIQAWQIQYFGSIGNPSGAPDADPDGDGLNNLREFLAGTDPTNSVSYWRIQATPTNGALPLAVSFTENSTGPAITNRLWTFGDGGTGSGTNPSHTYSSAGAFSVGLTIFNLSGTATLVASNLITVSPVAIWTNANVSGNWSVASSWDPVAIPDHNCGVIFGTAGVTANVDNVSRTVSNITFNRLGDFCVTASGGAALIVSNGITVTTNFTYTISAPVVLGGTNTWSVTSNGTLQVSGPVGGSNSITTVGGGTLILSGTNTYSGGTTVSNGVLKVVGTGLITNTASIDIASGATLDVSGRTGGSLTLVSGQTLKGGGTVQGNLIVADDSTLSPGGSVGTLTFLNDLVVSNAAVLQYDLGTNSDLIAVSSNLTLGGTLNINDAGGFNGGVYTLFTYGGTLAYDGVTIGAVPLGYTYVIDTNTAGQVRLNVVPGATISVEAADLQDRLGNLMPISGVAALVADTGTNGFVDLQPAFPLSLGATWGADDRVVGLWDLSDDIDGVLEATTIVPYTRGVALGQSLQLYWFPSLTLASNTVGVTYYGKYADTNSPPVDGSDVWESGPSVSLKFVTADEGGSNPNTAGRATLFTAAPPVARFTASPTSGTEPLAVTFTDTSTGMTPLSLTWNLGDSTTTNTAGAASFVRTYAAGTYTVTLTASNSLGVSTLVSNNLITAVTALQAWQLRYFGCTNLAVCPQAAGDADPDGDGLNNLEEFLTGTVPTNNASAFRITAVACEGNDVRVTWSMGVGKTNALQAATSSGSITNNFTDVFVVTNTVDTATNHLDVGAGTNASPRFYRIRLVP